MIEPKFELSQSADFVIFNIEVPFAKVTETQVEYVDNDFYFYSKPYHLKLHLPAQLKCLEEPTIKYDVDKRMFTIHAPKATPGELFKGLDLLTKLRAPKMGKAVVPVIEVLENQNTEDEISEFNWDIDHVPLEEQTESIKLRGQQCGFANSYSFSVFNMKEETQEIFEVQDPQKKSFQDLKKERTERESKQFDEDHYIADLYQDEEIKSLLQYQTAWDILYDEHIVNGKIECADDKVHFTSDEKDRLRKLPNKEYLLDKAQAQRNLLSLVDILFAYAYDKRTTEEESNVESGWTINTLSATLSWLEVFSSVTEVSLSCIRRSLCYPLYRHFELSLTVLEDVRKILSLGRKYVIKCLLDIHQMFNHSEPRYILNDLFITDYCVWMQSKCCSSSKLKPIADALGKVLLTKGDIHLGLVDIESFARIAWLAHNSPDTEPQKPKTPIADICSKVENLSLDKTDHSNSEDSEWEDCSSCSSDDSYSDCSTLDTSSSDSEESERDSDESETDSDDSEDFLLAL